MPYIPESLIQKKPMFNHYEPPKSNRVKNESLNVVLNQLLPPRVLKKILEFAKKENINLNNPLEVQKLCDKFAPNEHIDLTELEGTQIPYEVPKLETPEALEVAEKQKNGETRPENGV